jgi:hypothetical protein
MMKKAKPVRPKKTQSACDQFVNALSPKERLVFEEEYKDFVLSELLLAIMAQDEISVRELARMADVSPTVVQAMRSGAKKDFSMTSFFKILKGLGFKKLTAERNGQSYSLDIPDLRK